MLRRLSAFDGEAVLPLADAKAQCEVEDAYTGHDNLIKAFRDAAVAHVERVTNLILTPGEFEWEGTAFPRDLPARPVHSVDTVTYVAGDGMAATYTGTRLSGNWLLPSFGSAWPSSYGAVKVRFTAGLLNLEGYADVVLAVRMLTAHAFANREAVSDRQMHEMPLAAASLLGPHMWVAV